MDTILDRLVHNAHRLEMSGESMRRLRQSAEIKYRPEKPERKPVENILAKRMSEVRPAKQTAPYGALGSAAPVCFAPWSAIFSRPQRSHLRQLDQDKFIVPVNFNDPSPHMRAIVGIRKEDLCDRAVLPKSVSFSDPAGAELALSESPQEATPRCAA